MRPEPLRTLTACLALALLARGLHARSPEFKSAVNAQVAAARRVAPEIGVHILELESGETPYSFNPSTLRVVASNAKLATSAAALDRLGPGFFFETEIMLSGSVGGGSLRGDLAVVGGGDPHISGREYLGDSYGAFREWAAALRRAGVRRVEGDLALVTGIFDDEHVHPDWPRDQLTRWYEAPVAALAFNDSCVLVKVRPGPRVGSAAEVEVVPELGIFDLQSSATTTGRPRQQWLRIDRQQLNGSPDMLTVGGRIHWRTDSYDKWVTVADPVEYFGAALRAALVEEGIGIAGETRISAELAPAPEGGWRRLVTHRTDLLTVLEVVNKRSQNFYAESVLKVLGAKLCGRGSWPSGRRAVSEFLAEAGIEPGSYELADGSGMSRKNRFSPAQLTRLLRYMFFHRWGSEYVRTLGYSGERGLRWEERLAEAPYRGNVLAKTGSLSGISALSGYAKARSGEIYAFSILMNKARSQWEARSAQDRIVRAVIDHG